MKQSPEARALLERYRDALTPAAGARDRGLAELTRRIERGELPGARESGVRPRPSRGRPRASWSARWISAAIGGGVGVVAVFSWQLATQFAEHAPRLIATAQPAAVETAVVPTPPPPMAAEAEPSAPEPRAPVHVRPALKNQRALGATPHRSAPVPDRTPRPDARGVRLTAAKAVGAAQPPAPAPTLPSGSGQGGELERELRLLRAAYAALRAGHPEIALSRLTEHAMRFPHGELAESRDVAQVMALCQAGQTAVARQHAEQVLRQHPGSANAARVRSLCAAP